MFDWQVLSPPQAILSVLVPFIQPRYIWCASLVPRGQMEPWLA
ncbi:rCG28633 [Rattus norvegicus]|uniref:RCG28633 n=1 Tax=Rattus norvegicus TaxID=10116 RepID=A6HUZ0_RAT|nr:rCG28633 [Rattus norvegicus]